MSLISCGIVIVRREKEGYRYLLLTSRGYIETGPKGKQDIGETNLQTALRECEEETGIRPHELVFKWGFDYIETEAYGKKNKVARFFVAETELAHITLPINPERGEPEHQEWRWATYEQASSLVGPRIKRVLDWAEEKVNEDTW